MTIPSYLALGEMGLGTAVANDVSLSMAKGAVSAANKTLNTASAFYVLLLNLTLVTGVLLCLLFPIEVAAAFGPIIDSPSLVLIGLVIYVYANLNLGLLMAVYRGIERNARGIVVGSHSKLADFLITGSVLIGGGGPPALLASLVAGRIVFTALVLYDIRRVAPSLRVWGRGGAVNEFKRLLPSGLGFFAFSGGLALTLQGMTILVNVVLGPVAVVSFTIIRSFVRLISQVMGLISNSVWPEFSTLYARKEFILARRLHRLAVAMCLYLAIVGIVVVVFVGPTIISIWTHGQVEVSRKLIMIFALPVLCNAVWQTSSTVLWATNQHGGLAVRFGLSACISLLLAYPLLHLLGLAGAAFALLIFDLVLIPYVIKSSCRLVQDQLKDFLFDICAGSSMSAFVRHRIANRNKKL